MKLCLPSFVLASLWQIHKGRQQVVSALSLRGRSDSSIGIRATVDAMTTRSTTEDEPNATDDVIDIGNLAPTTTVTSSIIKDGEQKDVLSLRHRRLGLTDWTMCSASSQCNNGCCSGTYSGGVLKCTPLNGGYRADLCVGGGSGPSAPPSGSLGDWTQCSTSSECYSGCCSGSFTYGVLTCTPLVDGICVGSSPLFTGGETELDVVSEPTPTPSSSTGYYYVDPNITPLPVTDETAYYTLAPTISSSGSGREEVVVVYTPAPTPKQQPTDDTTSLPKIFAMAGAGLAALLAMYSCCHFRCCCKEGNFVCCNFIKNNINFNRSFRTHRQQE